MAEYIKRIRTSKGDKQIDYNALANLPNNIPLWQPNTEYKEGVFIWLIESTGFLMPYRCMLDHTSGEEWNNSNLNWMPIQVAEADMAYTDMMGRHIPETYAEKFEIIAKWYPYTNYKVGQYVYTDSTYVINGISIYRCNTAHTSGVNIDVGYFTELKYGNADYATEAQMAQADMLGNLIHETYALKGGWQLKEDITLTEAVSQIDISKEKLQYKEVHIEGLIIPNDTEITSQTVMLGTGGHNFWQGKFNPKGTGRGYFICDLYISPDNKVLCNGSISSYHYTQGESFTSAGYYFLQDNTYEYISDLFVNKLYIKTNNVFGVDTKIKVWGR